MSDDRETGGFRVTDRRRFAGEATTEESDAASAVMPDEGASAADLETVTFASVVMGLSAQALMHLGEIADASGTTPARDLDAAQHLIDILAVLQAKTAGNLSEDEAGLLEAMLYDLRIRYVTIAKHPGDDPGKETS
jgi:Domain of unknown function (DUF1844)